jgi:Bacterial Ig domain
MYQRTRERLLKLRSNFLLLLVVCAALLAAPAIVMALITDLGVNKSPTIQSDKADIADPGANPHGNASPANQGEEADIAAPSADTLPAQTIQSEEAVYASGKTVTLTGSNWQPGESVHINVDDDQGKTWSRSVDVTADASGRIQVHFQLPDRFGATYKVTAMGDQSGVATTSFIDGHVSFRSTSPAPANWTVNYRTHGSGNTTDNTCATGGADGSKTIFPDTTGTASVGVSNKESMRLGTVTVPADSTLVFDHWTDQNGNTVANDACLSGDPSGTNGNITDLIAHFDSAKQTPEAQPQPILSTDEDTAKTITLSGTDEDGDNLIFFIVTGPSHGTLGPIGELTCVGTAPRTCSANVTYTPDNEYNGFDIFSFKASDGTEGSYPAPVSMLVNPVNDTPVATDETKTMSEDGGPLSIDFGALVSDGETSDADLTYDITKPDPAKGSLGGEGSTRNFTPAANFNGTVNIDYTPADRGDPDNCSEANPPCAADKISAQKTLTVTVDAVNDAPSFSKGPDQTKDEDAGAQTVDDWATAISAGPNESGQQLTFEVTNDNNGLFAAGGQPSVAPNGTLTYTPAADKNGSATVTIKARDSGGTANGGQDASAEQTFEINVAAVNDAPGFQKGANETVNEGAGAQSIPNWATDISAGPNESNQTVDFRVTNDTNLFTAGGQPAIDASGKLTYEAAPNANGSAMVTVKPHDDGSTLNGGADTSAEQTFEINVAAVNDAPIARADTLATDEDTKLVFSSSDLVGNEDEGADNEASQTLIVTEVYEGNDGTVSLGSDGNITFTPGANFSGDATFRYLLCDNGSPSKCSVQRATVNVTAVNDAPVADNQSVTTDEDTAKKVNLSASDVEGEALGYTIVSAPQHGILSGKGANLTYIPAEDYRGPDSFTFKASDGIANSDLATVSIAVNAVNNAPVATNDTMSTNEDTPLVFAAGRLLGNDYPGPANERGQTLMITAADQAVNGQVSLDTNGTITFTPATDFNGQASFEYTVCDNGSPSECSEMIAIVNVRMSPVNDAPSFTAGANQTVAEDSGPHSIPGWATNISAGSDDESDQRLTFEVTNNTNTELFSTQPSVAANGTLSYALAADKNGSADVTVRLKDNGGIANRGADTSAEQSFTINVTAVNDAPIVSNLQGDGAANEGDVKTYTFDIADVDSSAFSASIDCGGTGKGELVAGSVQISGTNGEFECKFLDGLASPTPVNISVQVSDGDKLSNVESRSVIVSNVAPVLTGVSSSSQNALAGTLNPVTFTGTATDVSPIDLAAGFSWRWAIDGGAYGPVGAVGANTFTIGGANNQLYFSTCGTHTVEAQAGDKDGGVSPESPQATQSVSVYNGAFSPPLVDGTTNMVQKGQIVPVEIFIGCGTTNLTNLTPHIELLSGNVSPETESGSTTVTPTSVLAADTGQTMRPVDGGYLYNLQVPSNAAANQEYTIRVNPFGATADHAATGMYVVIKIRK